MVPVLAVELAFTVLDQTVLAVQRIPAAVAVLRVLLGGRHQD